MDTNTKWFEVIKDEVPTSLHYRFKFFIENGPKSTDSNGETLLMRYVRVVDQPSHIEYIVKELGIIISLVDLDNSNAAHHASSNPKCSLQTLEALKRCGCYLGHFNKCGQNPFECYLKYANPLKFEVLEYLLSYGNLNDQYNASRMSILIAVTNPSVTPEMLDKIYKSEWKEVELHKSKTGQTPLMIYLVNQR